MDQTQVGGSVDPDETIPDSRSESVTRRRVDQAESLELREVEDQENLDARAVPGPHHPESLPGFVLDLASEVEVGKLYPSIDSYLGSVRHLNGLAVDVVEAALERSSPVRVG